VSYTLNVGIVSISKLDTSATVYCRVYHRSRFDAKKKYVFKKTESVKATTIRQFDSSVSWIFYIDCLPKKVTD
jgi:hypothetical protein